MTLSIAREKTGVVILNHSAKTLPELIEVIGKLLPLNVFGVEQTPSRSIDKVQILIKIRHVKNRELVPDAAPLNWNLDPYNSDEDGVYRLQYNEEMQPILISLVGLVNERFPNWIVKKQPGEWARSTPVHLSLNLYQGDELYTYLSFVTGH